MSHHNYLRIPIKEGEEFSLETCRNCGQISRRYKANKRTYFNDISSVFDNIVTACTGVDIRKKVNNNTIMQQTNDKPFKINVEARLEEALVLINLMYEDLVKNDVNSKSKRMAGTFLYSAGYEELEEYLSTKRK